jgi:Mn2+/Fe2+ NRAMP family transporter
VKAKDLLNVVLGIITGIGGFLEVGNMATAAAAGAEFGYKLIWVFALSTICLIFLIEMCGRLAAISKHAVADAVRERFGFPFTVVPRTVEVLVNLLVLASEIGGVCLALKLATGWPIAAWALPAAFLIWLVIWISKLDWIENTTAIIGMITVCFVIAAWKMHPNLHDVARGLIPQRAPHDAARYWFIAVSMAGAVISPYMFHFYSSGAIEEEWNEDSLPSNRLTAILGMGFGCVMSIGVLVASAMLFEPRGIRIDKYEQLAIVLTPIFHGWGFWIFVVSLFVCCFGAAVELALGTAYMLGQTLGWNWSENRKPKEGTRFAVTYTLMLLAGGLVMVTGVDPLKLTMLSMALTSVILPVMIVPFLLLLNDEEYVHEHRNGWLGNTVVIVTTLVASVMAIVAIPLELLGGG